MPGRAREKIENRLARKNCNSCNFLLKNPVEGFTAVGVNGHPLLGHRDASRDVVARRGLRPCHGTRPGVVRQSLQGMEVPRCTMFENERQCRPCLYVALPFGPVGPEAAGMLCNRPPDLSGSKIIRIIHGWSILVHFASWSILVHFGSWTWTYPLAMLGARTPRMLQCMMREECM